MQTNFLWAWTRLLLVGIVTAMAVGCSGGAGPTVLFVDPSVVYNGISTRVTLYAIAIKTPLQKDAVTIVPHKESGPVTTLEYTAVPNRPNRLSMIVPAGQAPGTYDLTVKDDAGKATLENALRVTDTLTISLKSITPTWGQTGIETALTLLRDTAAPAPANAPFVATPRIYLNPAAATAADIAVGLQSVTFLDGDRATAVVPPWTPAHVYDVVIVNPDGGVGVLKNGFTETTNAPPEIEIATPSSIVAATGQVVVLSGKNFAAGDTVTLLCVDAAGAAVAAPAVTATAPACTVMCTQQITINASTLPVGSVCVVRVTNPDSAYGEYSAIGVTNTSLNLSSPRAGPSLVVGRRALVSAAGNATTANRFVYAIGGDGGNAAGALDSVELASVDLFGKISPFMLDPISLPSKRTLAGSVTVGRYIYLIGGDDGTGPQNTAVRALILSPREAPRIDDVDISAAEGLSPGTYHYRVSATFSAADTDNPNGESLASDEYTLTLPASDKKAVLTVTLTPPVDSLGAPLPNVSGYRIYRTAMDGAPGSEVLLATISAQPPDGGTVLTYRDDGTAKLGTETPLPLGTTGKWASLPNLGTARSGLAVAWAKDPTAAGTLYVYALLGKSNATTALASYELLPVTVAANGRQTVGGAWTPGTAASIAPRWQIGAWVVDSTIVSAYGAATWIFVGGGLTGADGAANNVDAALVGAGGQLGTFDDGPKDYSSNSAGYGLCAANGQLFSFGGLQGAPSAGAKSATILNTPPQLATNSWNNEGLTMTHSRYLLGSSVRSAFIFLLGGQTDEPSPASKTTELVIW